LAYDSKGRFASYWHQIAEIAELQPGSVLEVGPGNGLVASYLRARGLGVTTLDIDGRLRPDVVGSIRAIPFPDQTFHSVVAFEVLEHLPYADFVLALAELHRVAKKYAVVSLPDSNRVYRCSIQVPRLGEMKRLVPLPRLRPPAHRFDGQHHWEIGKAGYGLRRVVSSIDRSGFRLLKTFRVFEMPYHRFFVLGKGDGQG
jgi:SAM-dependent methyltransferase